MSSPKRNILWIDSNINTNDNQRTLNYFRKELWNFDIFPVGSIEAAEGILKSKLENSNGTPKFAFRLIYVIVSGRLAKDWFDKYIYLVNTLNILAATIVFCYNLKEHSKKPYFEDPFLNPGGVVSHAEEVVKYILADEENIKKNIKKIKVALPNHKESTMQLETVYSNKDIAYPLILNELINTSLISNDEFTKFQERLLSYYPNSWELIKPSANKKIEIPYHILAKFYLKLASTEKTFFRYLSKYKALTYLLYSALKKKTLTPFKQSNIYRYDKIKKGDYKKLIEYFSKSKDEIKATDERLFYFITDFTKFTKNKAVVNYYYLLKEKKENKLKEEGIEIKGNDEEEIPVIFEIYPPLNNKFFVSNIDMEKITGTNMESEVVILPFSLFQVIHFQDFKIYSDNPKESKVKPIKMITLYYPEKSLIEQDNEKLSKKNSGTMLMSTEKTKLGLEIYNILGKEINDKLVSYYDWIPSEGDKDISKYIQAVHYCDLPKLNNVFKLTLNKVKMVTMDSRKSLNQALMYSDNLYSLYIPKKYRMKGCNPSINWKLFENEKCKSFVLEMIENMKDTKWLILNIPGNCEGIKSWEEQKIEGDQIIPYKGISPQAYKVHFVLYELSNENKISKKDWENTELMKKLILRVRVLEAE